MVVDHHAIDLLRHVHLIIARLALLLVCLALLAIAVFVEARRGTTASHRLLLLFKHFLLAVLLLLLLLDRQHITLTDASLVLNDIKDGIWRGTA